MENSLLFILMKSGYTDLSCTVTASKILYIGLVLYSHVVSCK